MIEHSRPFIKFVDYQLDRYLIPSIIVTNNIIIINHLFDKIKPFILCDISYIKWENESWIRFVKILILWHLNNKLIDFNDIINIACDEEFINILIFFHRNIIDNRLQNKIYLLICKHGKLDILKEIHNIYQSINYIEAYIQVFLFNHVEVAKFLIKNVKSTCINIFILACQYAQVDLIKELNLINNASNSDIIYALNISCNSNRISIVKFIVKNYYYKLKLDESFYLLCQLNRDYLCKFMLKYIDDNKVIENGYQIACAYNSKLCIDVIYKK